MLAIDGATCGDRCAAKFKAPYPTSTQYDKDGKVIRYGGKFENGALVCFGCGAAWTPEGKK